MKQYLSIPFLLITLLCALTQCSFAEPKAEPLQLQFRPGNPTATAKGHLTGDLEYDYAIAAQKGQWMMVEVTSNPVDAAVFSIKTPSGSETTSQYRWSGVVQETGDYLLWVSKPADYRTADFTLKVTLGARPAPLRYSATDRNGAALYAAMRKFIDSFKTKDRTAFLSCFSRSKPSYHLNPIIIGSKSYYRTAVTYPQLASDLKAKKSWYWIYLERAENGELDAFVDNVPNGNMWTRTANNTFVPPGAEITSSTYVKWRKEGSQWFIDEISYPRS
ncbi:hypothetical protein EON83_08130 [bacterium]|nr:MAG: hypothetical protein EON83_08130 [bacterium]